MNGRVYDPLLARFGVPDPMTESLFSTQGWNRYSYVGNSPTSPIPAAALWGVSFPRLAVGHRTRTVQCRERLGGLLRYYHREAA
jgi:hypothetical protein